MADPLKEIQEALDWLALLARPVIGARPSSPAAHQSKHAADLLAHIDRQREEIAGWKDIALRWDASAEQVASLSSQLERQREEIERLRGHK